MDNVMTMMKDGHQKMDTLFNKMEAMDNGGSTAVGSGSNAMRSAIAARPNAARPAQAQQRRAARPAEAQQRRATQRAPQRRAPLQRRAPQRRVTRVTVTKRRPARPHFNRQ